MFASFYGNFIAGVVSIAILYLPAGLYSQLLFEIIFFLLPVVFNWHNSEKHPKWPKAPEQLMVSIMLNKEFRILDPCLQMSLTWT